MNARQLLDKEVAALRRSGRNAEVWEHENQLYVWVESVLAPAPPWDRRSYQILIAVPAAYDQASLDAFYLGLPYTWNGRTHERVNGGEIRVRDRLWKLVSWHYLDGKHWQAGKDTLGTHIVHSEGFFSDRGKKA